MRPRCGLAAREVLAKRAGSSRCATGIKRGEGQPGHHARADLAFHADSHPLTRPKGTKTRIDDGGLESELHPVVEHHAAAACGGVLGGNDGLHASTLEQLTSPRLHASCGNSG